MAETRYVFYSLFLCNSILSHRIGKEVIVYVQTQRIRITLYQDTASSVDIEYGNMSLNRNFAQCRSKISCKYKLDINLTTKTLNRTWGLCILVQVFRFHCRFMKKRLSEHIRYCNFKGWWSSGFLQLQLIFGDIHTTEMKQSGGH
jgi:hypothetical protein